MFTPANSHIRRNVYTPYPTPRFTGRHTPVHTPGRVHARGRRFRVDTSSPLPPHVQNLRLDDIAHMSLGGFNVARNVAWIVTQNQVYMWSYGAAQAHQSGMCQLELPESLEPFTCERTVSLTPNGFCAVSVEGTLRWWPSPFERPNEYFDTMLGIVGGAKASMISLLESGLLVCGTSKGSGRGSLYLVELLLRNNEKMQAKVSAVERSSGIGMISGIGSWFGFNRQQSAPAVITLVEDGNRELIVLTDTTVERWVESSDLYKFSSECALRDALMKRLEAGSVWLVDMQRLSGEKVVVLAVHVQNQKSGWRDYRLSLVEVDRDNLADFTTKWSSPLETFASEQVGAAFEPSLARLVVIPRASQNSDVCVVLPGCMVVVQLASKQHEHWLSGDQFFGVAAKPSDSSIMLLSRMGVLTMIVNDDSSSDRMVQQTPVKDVEDPRSANELQKTIDEIRSALAHMTAGDFESAKIIATELFNMMHHQEGQHEFRTLPTDAIVTVSKQLVDAESSEQDVTHTTHNSNLPLLIKMRLDEKAANHDRFLGLLTMDLGEGSLLTCLDDDKRVKVLEHAEKLRAAAGLRSYQNTMDETVASLTKHAMLHSRKGLGTVEDLETTLLHRGRSVADEFYNHITEVHLFLPSLPMPPADRAGALSLPSDRGTATRDFVMHSNELCLAVLRPAWNFRATHKEHYPESYACGWTGLNTLRDRIRIQLQMTGREAKNTNKAEVKEMFRRQLCSLAGGFLDEFDLEVRQARAGVLKLQAKELESLVAKHKGGKRAAIEPLKNCGYLEDALALAERHLAFDIIVEVCLDQNDITDGQARLLQYMQRFKEHKFPRFLFEWYKKEGRHASLLELSSVKGFEDDLAEFLAPYPELLWKHSIRPNSSPAEYTKASNVLMDINHEAPKSNKRRKILLSLALLTGQAGESQGPHRIQQIYNELDIVRVQEELCPEAQGVLAPVNLIEELITRSRTVDAEGSLQCFIASMEVWARSEVSQDPNSDVLTRVILQNALDIDKRRWDPLRAQTVSDDRMQEILVQSVTFNLFLTMLRQCETGIDNVRALCGPLLQMNPGYEQLVVTCLTLAHRALGDA